MNQETKHYLIGNVISVKENEFECSFPWINRTLLEENIEYIIATFDVDTISQEEKQYLQEGSKVKALVDMKSKTFQKIEIQIPISLDWKKINEQVRIELDALPSDLFEFDHEINTTSHKSFRDRIFSWFKGH